MMAAAFLAELGRWTVGFFMLAAAVGKLRGFAAFRDNLSLSFGVAPRFAGGTAVAVLAAEALSAALLLAGPARLGMQVALALLTVFTLVLAYTLWHKGLVRCSCFGEDARPVSRFDIVRNLLALAGAALVLASAPAAVPPSLSVLAAALATGVSVVLIGLPDIALTLEAP